MVFQLEIQNPFWLGCIEPTVGVEIGICASVAMDFGRTSGEKLCAL